MIDKLARHKRRVDEWALRAFGRVVEEVGGLGWPEEWIGAVREMIPGGKGMRAGLVIETARAFDGRIKPEEIMPVAAALELMQAALLIQDDVMDGDELRRGGAGAPQRGGVVGEVGGLGKVLGVMFQIKDDMLNVFGEVAETGKSVGSDVVEDKQTVIRAVGGEVAKNDGKA